MSRILERSLKLPPPQTRDLAVHRDLQVPMRDGAVLLADRWAPRSGAEDLPTLLIRTPYGRAGLFGKAMVIPFAERGFQVLVQSTRGGFGSGGVFDPLRQEREDGLDTLDWVIAQPWFGEAMVLFGPSYMGFVQWAVADELPPQVKAMIPQVTESALTREFLRGDGFSLETPFGWGAMVATQERSFPLLRQHSQHRRTERAIWTLPLKDADVRAIGERSQYLQDILVHDADDPFWSRLDHRERVATTAAPVSSIGGWFDIFLDGQLRDFKALQEAGKDARLTIGPWTHAEFNNVSMMEVLEFGLAHARGEAPPERDPVRLFVMGEEAWRDFPSWPPPGYEPQRFHLQSGGRLSAAAPPEGGPSRYRYDPADPTPSVGGTSMMQGGRKDNRELESRPDVLTFTTAPLDADVEVVGEVSAEVWFQSSLPFADVFVRLCDVDEEGVSSNVCDGLTSLTGADVPTLAEVNLWATAHRFKRGHRIRIQVSSGAFPRYARNHGTGDPIATAVELRAADQTVHHDPERPSAIILPCATATPKP
ncbi:CocE/NonD family hydrolase [Glycomyces rhizosphaerae]|uniref:CocE/NonD family hydrolase n=1 Tax=Glycomyces rhizosphaerae TaxID=2054422 RepID=A0ABV7PXR6_9ACTN